MRGCLHAALDAYIREDTRLCIRLRDSQKLYGRLRAYDDICLRMTAQSGQDVITMLSAIAAIVPEDERG